jgi:hypothetical protein
MRKLAMLLVLAMVGCDDDDEEQLADGGAFDAGSDAARDANLDARTDASTGCHSPLALPASRGSDDECACFETPANDHRVGYCLEGAAVLCQGVRWQFVLDGPCFPTSSPFPVGSCARQKGTEIDAGSCPSGFATRQPLRTPWDGGAGEVATCCYPIDVTRSNCEGAGHRVETAASATPSLDRRCASGTLKAFVVADSGTALCCD